MGGSQKSFNNTNLCHTCVCRLEPQLPIAKKQMNKFKDTSINSQILIHKYIYTNTNTQIQVHKYKYINTNTQINKYRYK